MKRISFFKCEKISKKKYYFKIVLLIACISAYCQCWSQDYGLQKSSLSVGAASVDITPPLPVALQGQMYVRVAKEIETPVTANVLVVKSEKGEPIVFVSCDLVSIKDELMSAIIKETKVAVPQIDTNKIIVNAIHDHAAPTISLGYEVPEGVHNSEDNIKFISKKIARGVEDAWNDISEGSVTWGFGYASVATNRRSTYVDGTHQMYGDTHLDEFRGLEWASPNKLNVLFFWDNKDNLVATAIDVPCPAQVTEHHLGINGDYMHVVRENLKKRFGDNLVVLGWIDAAGDQSPHPMVDGPVERLMRKTQGITRVEQLGNRISRAVERIYNVVERDKHDKIVLTHKRLEVSLTKRPVTLQNKKDAQAAIDAEMLKPENERRAPFIGWKQRVIDRYDAQLVDPHAKYKTIVHVVRLGDIAISTNQFELFHEYGEQIVARSKALQTFNVQLTGAGTYLPSKSALLGGGYSAIIESNYVGLAGGQELVEHSVGAINSLFEEDLHQDQRGYK